MRALPFFLVLTLPAFVVCGVELGGAWTFLAAAVVYLALPLLDLVGGLETENRDDEGWLFDVPLTLWLPLQIAGTAWVLWRVASGDPTWLELVGIVVSLGAVNGAGGINASHELMHRQGRLAKATAEVLLYGVCYPHFVVEHVLGHHRRVATPEDSAYSPMGQSLYPFVVSSAVRSLISAWKLEGVRTTKRGIQALSPRNRQFRYPVVQTLVCVGIWLAVGPLALGIFLAQSLVAIFLLETINYLEHYGLLRREIAPGRYERVRPEHSWNASQRVSNWMLFNLARHSDHHFLASRHYAALRHYDDVPQLPASYAAMILVAMVPPVWKRVMDPRVIAWNSKGASNEGVRPAKTDRPALLYS
jgi:alkane 1-monooxygenase